MGQEGSEWRGRCRDVQVQVLKGVPRGPYNRSTWKCSGVGSLLLVDLRKEVDGWQLPFLVSASLPFGCGDVSFLDQVVEDGVPFNEDSCDPLVHLLFIQFQVCRLVRELPFRLEGVISLAE